MAKCGFRYIVFSQVQDPSKLHVSGGEYDPNKKIHLVFPYSEGDGFGQIPTYLNDVFIRQISNENIAKSTTTIGKNLKLSADETKNLTPMISADGYLIEKLEDKVYQLEKHIISASPEGFIQELKRLIKEEKNQDSRKKGYDTMIANYIEKVTKGEIPIETLLSTKQSM